MDETRRTMRRLLAEQRLPDERVADPGVDEPEDIGRLPDPPREEPVDVSGYPAAGAQAPSPVKKVIADFSRLPP